MVTDALIVPRIAGLTGKTMTLQRRREYLERQIREQRGSATALEFAQQEHDALGSAVDVMRYHRSIAEDLDNPLTLLREFVEVAPQASAEDLANLIKRAQGVLDEYGA